MKDVISIIVPVYNVEKYVKKCVQSIINQTYEKLEIILIDDGSKDSSGYICDEIAKEYEKVQVHHKINGGLSDARNYGMQYATGEYIMFVDSDDYMKAEMVEKLYKAMIRKQADVSVCGFTYVYEDRAGDVPYRLESKEEVYTGRRACEMVYEEPYDVLMTVVWNKLYRRSFFEHVTYPVGKKHEDDFTTYKILYQAKQVVFINEPLYCYLQRSGSIMSDLSNDRIIDEDILEALRERTAYYIERRERKLAGMTILKYLDKCIDRYDTMKKRKEYTKKQCSALRMDYCRNYQMIWKTDVSIVRKVYYGIFCLLDDAFRKKHFQYKFKMYPDL